MMEILKALQTFEIVAILFVAGDVKVRDYCRVTWKYRGAAHIVCNINVSLN